MPVDRSSVSAVLREISSEDFRMVDWSDDFCPDNFESSDEMNVFWMTINVHLKTPVTCNKMLQHAIINKNETIAGDLIRFGYNVLPENYKKYLKMLPEDPFMIFRKLSRDVPIPAITRKTYHAVFEYLMETREYHVAAWWENLRRVINCDVNGRFVDRVATELPDNETMLLTLLEGNRAYCLKYGVPSLSD